MSDQEFTSTKFLRILAQEKAKAEHRGFASGWQKRGEADASVIRACGRDPRFILTTGDDRWIVRDAALAAIASIKMPEQTI